MTASPAHDIGGSNHDELVGGARHSDVEPLTSTVPLTDLVEAQHNDRTLQALEPEDVAVDLALVVETLPAAGLVTELGLLDLDRMTVPVVSSTILPGSQPSSRSRSIYSSAVSRAASAVQAMTEPPVYGRRVRTFAKGQWPERLVDPGCCAGCGPGPMAPTEPAAGRSVRRCADSHRSRRTGRRSPPSAMP
ncbi:hypothetical protein NBCG_01647 [Nocardioidaceae bacterium Broad-1]|nr:hypothetical protein NBCG_01647 [Nocardioidaceae bacterium Broad-1]